MAGKLIPMRELRALAKRAGANIYRHRTHHTIAGWYAGVWVNTYSTEAALGFASSIKLTGLGRTKRAAQIQARENAKLFLECVLAMEYGEATP